MSTDEDTLLTANEVAARLHTTKTSVFRLAKAGELPALRISAKIVRFRLSDVEALLARAAS